MHLLALWSAPFRIGNIDQKACASQILPQCYFYAFPCQVRLQRQCDTSRFATAISYLRKKQLDFDGLLIAACDQPLIKLDHYKKLIYSCINRNRIVVSSFDNGRGIPVVFDKIYFDELSTLTKDIGAKSIVKKHLDRLVQIDAPEAAIDLDTKERYDLYYHTHGIDRNK